MGIEFNRLDVLNGIVESAQQLEELATDMVHKGTQYALATTSLLANWGAIEIWVRRTSPPNYEMMTETLAGLSGLGAKMDDILSPPCSIRPESRITEDGTATADENAWMQYRLAMRRIHEVLADFRSTLVTEVKPKRRGPKKQYNAKDDEKVLALWDLARNENGKLSIPDFLAENFRNISQSDFVKMLDRRRARRK